MSAAETLRLAAAISNPWSEDAPPELQPGQAQDVAASLGHNHASLLPLSKRLGPALHESRFFPYIEQEETAFRRLRGEFEQVRELFEARDIRTVFIKSTGLYPSFPHLSSNLDVMVPPQKGDDGRRTLRELGYVELINAEEPKKFLLRRFSGSGPSFTFHLHEQVGWGVPFIDSDAVWDNVREAPDDESVCIPGPEQALLITLAHWFYEDKALSLGNLFLTANALQNLSRPLDEVSKGACERGWEAGFYAALKIFDQSWQHLFGMHFLDESTRRDVDRQLEDEKYIRSGIISKVRYMQDMPAIVPFGANKIIYYRKILADQHRSSRQRAKDVFLTLVWAFHLKAKVRSQKPFLTGISGCDGSGKTVQAQALAQAFRTCGLRTKVLWSRGGSSNFMSIFIHAAKKLFSKRSRDGASSAPRGPDTPSDEMENVKLISRRQNLKNPFLRFAYSVLYSIDLSTVYCIKTRFFLLLGNAVICDRSLADAKVDFAMMSGEPVDHPPLAFKLLEMFAPRPHLAFLLDVDEGEALLRKPEEGSSEHLAEARAMFLDLAERQTMTVIASGSSREAVTEEITRKSLVSYYKRRGTVVNGLLFMNPGQLNPGRWRD
jgi:thymidylate kinase